MEFVVLDEVELEKARYLFIVEVAANGSSLGASGIDERHWR